MRFFSDSRVGSVLEDPKQLRWGQPSSCIAYTLRSCGRYLLALIAMDGMYAGFAGAKACHEKSLFFKASLGRIRLTVLVLLIYPFVTVQAEEIRDPMQPPAFALEKYRQAKFKNRVKPVKTGVKAQKPVVKPLKLTSILYSSDRKIAIIDDRMLRVGDTIRSAKLVRIDRDSARLLKKGKIIELKLTSDLSVIKKTPSESKL